MLMQSLLEVNRRNEAFRHRQLMGKMAKKFRQSRRPTLKTRFEVSVETLKLQLRALKLSAGINSLVTGKRPSLVKLCSRSRSGSSGLSSGAVPFRPKLISESSSSSDTESDVIDIQSIQSSQDDREFQKQRHIEREKALVGQTVVGRLNIFTPREGTTRYYLNWSSTKLDNICIDREIIEECIGLDRIKSGMRLVGTISHLGADYARSDKTRPYAGQLKLPTRKVNTPRPHRPVRPSPKARKSNTPRARKAHSRQQRYRKKTRSS